MLPVEQNVPDPARCPLCGATNACVMAGGAPAGTPCWCRDAEFPHSLLALVPDAARNLACICRACVDAHRAG